MYSPTNKQFSIQEERLATIRDVLNSQDSIEIKLKKITAAIKPLSGQSSLMKAIDADENIKAKLDIIIGKQENGEFSSKAVFLRTIVASLRIELEQKASKEIDAKRRMAAKNTELKSAPLANVDLSEPSLPIASKSPDVDVNVNVGRQNYKILSTKESSLLASINAKKIKSGALKKPLIEAAQTEDVTDPIYAEVVRKAKVAAVAPELPPRTDNPEMIVNIFISNLKTAISDYNIADLKSAEEGSDATTANETAKLFFRLELVDSNKEALEAVFADKALSDSLKGVVQFEIQEARKTDATKASLLEAQCPNLLAKFAELNTKEAAPPVANTEAPRPQSAPPVLGMRIGQNGSLTKPEKEQPTRPKSAPADPQQGRKDSFWKSPLKFIVAGFNNWRRSNKVAPEPINPEEKKRASLVSTIEKAATALKAISNESLKEGPFRLTMAIKKRNSIINGAEALDKEAESTELADLIKSAFKALDPSVPSLAIQEQLASLTLADSKSTGLENPNNKGIKAILDSMSQEDKRILDLVTDSMLHCKSGDSKTGTKMTIDNLAVVLGGCMMDKYNEQNPSTVQENALKFVTIATAVLNVRELENYEKKTPGNSPAVISQSALGGQENAASR